MSLRYSQCIRCECGCATFPMVPVHEIAGIAAESEVTKFAVGDHVGVVCFVNSCGEYEYCLSGNGYFSF